MIKNLKYLVATVMLASGLSFATPAFAFSQCTTNITQIYVGNGNVVWMVLGGGAHAFRSGATTSDSQGRDRDYFYSSAMTALTTDRQVAIRFKADGVNCNAIGVRNDVIGMYVR